ncbi:hypothetical protein CFIO01_10154 [Colletotrichum fioriniae PJ7]|uniref:Uncharacterized protein n=1 Tax=Colletotrichum fioriniae PJ7 TaxID=1445577 RepID=A0A010S5Q0_9PEZI|nr:hypothetical protein CFIO01_10154 [Colletotrichum fioriniae PJ7]
MKRATKVTPSALSAHPLSVQQSGPHRSAKPAQHTTHKRTAKQPAPHTPPANNHGAETKKPHPSLPYFRARRTTSHRLAEPAQHPTRQRTPQQSRAEQNPAPARAALLFASRAPGLYTYSAQAPILHRCLGPAWPLAGFPSPGSPQHAFP